MRAPNCRGRCAKKNDDRGVGPCGGRLETGGYEGTPNGALVGRAGVGGGVDGAFAEAALVLSA